jgi:hypothetical protein
MWTTGPTRKTCAFFLWPESSSAVDSGLSKFDRLTEQACEFPKGRHGHDDYIDTAALLNIELSKQMMTLPIRTPLKHPILAMLKEAQSNEMAQMIEAPEIDTNDLTGLD